jgi:hypothetical protein
MGYLVTADGSVHRIDGVAGAAWIRAAEEARLPAKFRAVIPAPRQDFVLGWQENEDLTLFSAGSSEALVLQQAVSAFALSPSGSAAAAYSHDRGIVVWKGLPRHPESRAIDSRGIGGELRALAVSDDGHRVVAGFEAGGQHSLYSLEDGQASLLGALNPAALAFLPGSRRAAAASGDGVFLLDGSLQYLAPNDDAVRGLAASADGTRLFLALADGVRILRTDGSGSKDVRCKCAPSAFERLNDVNLFRLTDPARGTLWLFDGRLDRERAFFVPREVAQ